MRRIYFDITDIVNFARKNSRVSGIQRVQARLVSLLAEHYGGEVIRCVYWDCRKGRCYECSAAGLFESKEFSAEDLLSKLGLFEKWGFLGSEVRKHAKAYSRSRLVQFFRKIYLRLVAAIDPQRLLAMGFSAPRAASGLATVERKPLRQLVVEDTIVLMGAQPLHRHVHRLVSDHSLRGGEVNQLIYDLLPHHWPAYFPSSLVSKYRLFLSRSIPIVSRYICISENTRRDMEGYLHEHAVHRDAVSLPLAHEFSGFLRNARDGKATSQPVASVVESRYILCVGTIEIRKNGAGLLKVWQHLIHRLGDRVPQLVFAGKRGWLTEKLDSLLACDVALANKVTILETPTDSDLAALYQRCLFAVYPSLAEGWGLPIGEAAWFGKYCVTSTTTSMPEVCGDLADYGDPNNHEQLAAVIERAIGDDAYRLCKEEAISKAPLRTWRDVAEDLFSLVQTGQRASASDLLQRTES